MQDIVLPQIMPDFDKEPYVGTFQQFFSHNVGKVVRIDVMVGLSNLKSINGVIYSVGMQYVNVYVPTQNQYVLCELSTLRFATIIPQ